MSKIVINLTTGERTVESYTQAELDDLAARQPEIQAEAAASLAAEAKRNEIAQAKTDAKADAFVQQFVNMTSAERNDYVDTACAGLPVPARNFLKKLAQLEWIDAKDKYK